MRWLPFRRSKQLELADDRNMRRLDLQAEEFYANILENGDEPAFVSDEATVFDLSSSDPEYLVDRCRSYYGVILTTRDLHLPFYLLLERLNTGRTHASGN